MNEELIKFQIINWNLEEKHFSELRDLVLSIWSDHKETRDMPRFLFFDLQEFNDEKRLELRRLKYRYPGYHVVLLSHKSEAALLAWKINAFFFFYMPVTKESLRLFEHRLYQFYIDRPEKIEMLSIPFKGGVRVLNSLDISVVKGQGQYCQFYFRNEKPELLTIRIGELGARLRPLPYFIKLNKSLLVNLNNIAQVEKDNAIFRGKDGSVKLAISRNVYKVLRDRLLWRNS